MDSSKGSLQDCGGRRRGARRGRWNRRFRAVQPLDLSALREPGRYRVRVGRASSPAFDVGAPADLLGPRVAESVTFFQAQRDGPDVIPGPLHRRPAHLNDEHAGVYARACHDVAAAGTVGPTGDTARPEDARGSTA